ncbi:MAG: phosphatidate cytidylyltransferase, partial [Candidatus Hinthialibacter antarcticus]|nr:phosphatidate cytidylyltransferase [Candidatus Hinthialibacter antarcticus]
VAVFVFFLVGRVELYALYNVKLCPNISIWQIAVGLLFMASSIVQPIWVIPCGLLFFWGSCILTIRHSLTGSRNEFAVHGLALIYLLGPLATLPYVRSLEHGPAFLFFLLSVACFTDTGAYFGGKLMGRTKLAPVLSPNKTWEGAVSGIALTVALVALSGYIHSHFWGKTFWIEQPYAFAELLSVTVVLSVIGQIGDLFESAIKRDSGAKDSGASNTGHGGCLDMIDGFLWIGPALAAYSIWAS